MSQMLPDSRFPALFQSGSIGTLILKNRLIMAAMGNALADNNGNVTDALLEHYRARAKGGVGLVITQFASISGDDVMPYNLRLDDDKFIPGITRLVEAIHQQGAKVAVQLMHPGMLFLLFKSLPAGQKIKVPSISPLLPKEREYQELTPGDIEKYIRDFVQAACRVKETGADALEIHACHGCLLSTFLFPALNRRSDEYGGSVANRARFIQQIVTGIKEKLGQDFPVIVRINGDDDIPGGVTPAEVVQYAEIFRNAGTDALSISSGLEYWTTLMAPSYLTGPGVVIPIAGEVKQKTALPVIVAGKITPALAEKTIAGGKADFVALGRPLLADPELPNKIYQGDLQDIRQCLYCNNCLRSSWHSCTVNPFLYRDSVSSLTHTGTPKKVMVIGGGLAGLQAAVLCKMKGHDVTLYEKESALGGQWRIASLLPGKGAYISIIRHWKRILDNYQVKVVMGREITREQVVEIKPDVAIIATGAVPLNLAIPGISGLKVVQARDVLQGKSVATGKTVVFGNTVLAMEMATLLAEQDREVVLVSPGGLGGKKGPDDMITFRGQMKRLIQFHVPIYLNAALLEAARGALLVRWGEEMLTLPCDTLVLVAGVQAIDKLSAELKGIVPEVYTIGDCVVPGSAAQATFSAARLALKL
jgi:2,4-dienoyl-CoA reductase-like NADH-dependent reductase (Old Yellow Enzyme family)/thioredoxin reductase